MQEKTKKNIATGMIYAGLAAIVISGIGTYINKNEINKYSSEIKRLQQYNSQIYYISIENPSQYRENISRIKEINDKIIERKQQSRYLNLFLAGSLILSGGVAVNYSIKEDEKNNKKT
jgi:hypothetical protein